MVQDSSTTPPVMSHDPMASPWFLEKSQQRKHRSQSSEQWTWNEGHQTCWAAGERKIGWNRLLPREGKKREGSFLEKILVFRIKTPGYQNLKQPVLLKNDLALSGYCSAGCIGVSSVRERLQSKIYMCLVTLLLSRLTAYLALVTFSTGAFVPALVLSLRVPYPKSVVTTSFLSKKYVPKFSTYHPLFSQELLDTGCDCWTVFNTPATPWTARIVYAPWVSTQIFAADQKVPVITRKNSHKHELCCCLHFHF